MARVIEPEVVKSVTQEKPVRLTKAGKPFREQRRGKIDQLPDEVRAELDRRLATDSFRNYEWLSQWLENEHSARISPSAINYRKKHKIDLQLLPVKYATEEAQRIVEATGGDNEEINRVLTVLVQTKLFDMLVDLNRTKQACDQVEQAVKHSEKVHEARRKRESAAAGASAPVEEDSTDPETGKSRYPLKLALAAVSVLTKNTTAIGEHVRHGEQWEIEREELWQKLEAASQKVSKVAREAGLSPEVEKSIRDALLEIKL